MLPLRPASPAAPIVTELLVQGVSSLEPIEGGGEVEDAHEADGGLLVAGGDGAPLLEPGPEALDLVAVVVDPIRAGHGRFVALRRDCRPSAHVPDVFAKDVAGIAAVSHDPFGHPRQLIEQGNSVREFIGLTGRQPEGDGAALPVGDHASLGAIATTRAAKSFTSVSLGRRSPLLAAPAFWCARTFVPSRNTMPSWTPRSCTR